MLCAYSGCLVPGCLGPQTSVRIVVAWVLPVKGERTLCTSRTGVFRDKSRSAAARPASLKINTGLSDCYARGAGKGLRGDPVVPTGKDDNSLLGTCLSAGPGSRARAGPRRGHDVPPRAGGRRAGGAACRRRFGRRVLGLRDAGQRRGRARLGCRRRRAQVRRPGGRRDREGRGKALTERAERTRRGATAGRRRGAARDDFREAAGGRREPARGGGRAPFPHPSVAARLLAARLRGERHRLSAMVAYNLMLAVFPFVLLILFFTSQVLRIEGVEDEILSTCSASSPTPSRTRSPTYSTGSRTTPPRSG